MATPLSKKQSNKAPRYAWWKTNYYYQLAQFATGWYRLKNVLDAYHQLAREVRSNLKGKVIAITGTIGKTTTRNIIATILRSFGTVNASEKSFNNHIGVPFTISNCNLEADFTVLELGMNHAGELTKLTAMARPDVGLITNVTPVHMEFFNSLSEIADAKLEMFDGLGVKGTALVNADNQELNSALNRWRQSHPKYSGEIIKFGFNQESQFRILNIKDLLTEGFEISITTNEKQHSFRIPLIGTFQCVNIAATIAIVLTVQPSAPAEKIQSGFSSLQPEAHRLNLLKLKDGRELLDDSYNSSPEALSAALNLMSRIKNSGKKVGLVLGGMHELGLLSEKYHLLAAQEIIKLSPEFCFLVGEVAKDFLTGLKNTDFPVRWFDTADSCANESKTQSFDITLIKGSRGVKLDKLIQILII